MREGTGGCEEDPDRECWKRGSAGGDLPAHVIQTTGPDSVVYTELSDQRGLEQDCLETGDDIFIVRWLGAPALLEWAESTEIV